MGLCVLITREKYFASGEDPSPPVPTANVKSSNYFFFVFNIFMLVSFISLGFGGFKKGYLTQQTCFRILTFLGSSLRSSLNLIKKKKGRFIILVVHPSFNCLRNHVDIALFIC